MSRIKPIQEHEYKLQRFHESVARNKRARELYAQRYADSGPMSDADRFGARAAMLLDNLTGGVGDEILGGVESLAGRGSYDERRQVAKELRRRGQREMPDDRAQAGAMGIAGLAAAPVRAVALPLAAVDALKRDGNKYEKSSLAGDLLGSGIKSVGSTIFRAIRSAPFASKGEKAFAAIQGAGANTVGAGLMTGSSRPGDEADEYEQLEDWKRAHTHGRPSTKQSERAKIRAEILKAMGR